MCGSAGGGKKHAPRIADYSRQRDRAVDTHTSAARPNQGPLALTRDYGFPNLPRVASVSLPTRLRCFGSHSGIEFELEADKETADVSLADRLAAHLAFPRDRYADQTSAPRRTMLAIQRQSLRRPRSTPYLIVAIASCAPRKSRIENDLNAIERDLVGRAAGGARARRDRVRSAFGARCVVVPKGPLMVDCLRRSPVDVSCRPLPDAPQKTPRPRTSGAVCRCAGTVAMVVSVVTTYHAQSGGWTVWDIGTLGGNYAVANDINDAGHVVGASSPPGGGAQAFLWTPSGGKKKPGRVRRIEQRGGRHQRPGTAFVGFSSQSSGPGVAFLWTAAGGMVSLGSLGGFSAAADINDAGHVVGAGVSGSRGYAFRWTAAGGIIDIGTLGGSSTAAVAINDAGQVVGHGDTARGDRHAFIWTATGGMLNLGTLGGATSTASDINEAGQVVGRSQTASGAEHAFVWTAAGGMVDLGALGPGRLVEPRRRHQRRRPGGGKLNRRRLQPFVPLDGGRGDGGITRC